MHNQQKDNTTVPGSFSWWDDIQLCLAFLTRIPIRFDNNHGRQLSDAARGFGIVGAIIGALAGMVFALCTAMGTGSLLAGLIAVGFMVIMTGGLHEDGLADCADGFGGWTRQKRLEIMRDSNIGSYGVLALIFATGLRVGGYGQILGSDSSLIESIIIFAAIGALSRSSMAMLMHSAPLARIDGAAVQAGRPSYSMARQAIAVAAGGGAAGLVLTAGPISTLFALVMAYGAFTITRKLADRQLGGYSGDVLGALQQLSEIMIIFGLII